MDQLTLAPCFLSTLSEVEEIHINVGWDSKGKNLIKLRIGPKLKWGTLITLSYKPKERV